MSEPLLSIRDLSLAFGEGGRVLDRLGLQIAARETYCLVGESGSGKSVTALSILGLLPRPPARYDSGEIRFGGMDLLSCGARELGRVRGRRIGMVFQEPRAALDPLFTVGEQLVETLRVQLGLGGREARSRAMDTLAMVGVQDPIARSRQYAHELSGGLCQRAMIALALCCGPELLLADEPTTALDATISAQILDLLLDLRERLGLSVLFITHDLGLVAELGGRVGVMQSGKIIEEATVEELFRAPQQELTRALLLARTLPPRKRASSSKREGVSTRGTP